MRSCWVSRYLLLAIAILLSANRLAASHLIGGAITYKYVGKGATNANFSRYEVKIAIYRDAANSALQFSDNVNLNIYDNGTGDWLEGRIVPSGEEKYVQPVGMGSSCKDVPNVKIYEMIYTTFVELAPNTSGYHLVLYYCCRNVQVNLKEASPGTQNQGQTYDAFIPGSNAKNTSPDFSDVPAPYICADEETTLINTAYEQDGDSLVYEMAWPYASDPMLSTSPPAKYTAPKLIEYSQGYSFTSPFGATGYVSIDKRTGATRVLSPEKGRFAFAIDVKEYRKGKLLSTTRRDIQVIVTSCKLSNPPERIPVNGAMLDEYEVLAGDTVHIPMGFTADDSLFAGATGEIFDASSGIIHKAELKPDAGKDTLWPGVTWVTDLRDARTQPYIANVKVWNDACPPKTEHVTLAITVVGTGAIYGKNLVCVGDVAQYGCKRVRANSILVWGVTGGTILSFPSVEQVIVAWYSSPGEIRVAEVNNGIAGDTVFKEIHVMPKPVTSGISGTTSACKGSLLHYSVVERFGSQYSWFIKGGKQVGGGYGSNIDVDWNEAGYNEVAVLEMDQSGCHGDTMKLPVEIQAPRVSTIYGSVSVCPNAKDIDYWVDAQNGSQYTWEVSGGKQSSGGKSAHITVSWGEQGSGIIKVTERTKDGCLSEVKQINVTKDYVLYTPVPDGDKSVCEYEKQKKYSVVNNNGSSYDWAIIGGSITGGKGTHEITVDWNSPGTGYLRVTETAFDAVNKKTCAGAPVMLQVSIHPLPKPAPITGPAQICQGDKVKWRVAGDTSSSFYWSISNGQWTSAKGMPQGHSLDSMGWPKWASDSVGVFTISVLEVSKDSCFTVPSTLQVKIQPLPKAKKILGAAFVCQPEMEGIGYSVAAGAEDVVEWVVTGGDIISGAGSNSISVNWRADDKKQVRCREITSFGCVGPWNALDVSSDSLRLQMDYVTTSRANDKQVELHFRILNSQQLKRKVRIYRQYDGQAGYTLVDTVPGDATLFIDRKIHTDQYAYTYYMAAENACGRTVKSALHRTIYARAGMDQDSMVTLTWNAYSGWPAIDGQMVYKCVNEDTALTFCKDVNPDTYIAVPDDGLDWQRCYRVESINKATGYATWSNNTCMDFDPILWIPNVFTPGSKDKVNPTFHVSVMHYRLYEINIYNRWGERVFYSDNPAIEWDGTVKGQPAADGIYLYTISLCGSTERIYRKGTVQVMR